MIVFFRAETAHEIEELFDAQLAQEAAIIFDTSIVAITQQILQTPILQKTVSGHAYERKISFQIWHDETLLFRSYNAPTEKLSQHDGYSDKTYQQKKWRVFATHETYNKQYYLIIAAEQYSIRNELIHDILLRATRPLLVALPILILLLHFSIKKGLKPLQNIACAVSQKDTMDFSPFSHHYVPKEIELLISALNTLLERLKIAFDKEKRFTNNAAHELRTPITAIQVQAQVAKRSIEHPQQLITALDNIIIATQRSTHLVEKMLTLARLEPEILKKQFVQDNIIDAIRQSITDAVPLALKKEIEITLTAIPEEGCECFHYPQGIIIMLNNLLQNALHYTPKKGQIHVSLACQSQYCMITVADTGIGIANDELDKVMDRYYRASDNKVKGCGLGLSIVKQIIDLHQGSIQLSNQEGLVVAITLPYCSRQA